MSKHTPGPWFRIGTDVGSENGPIANMAIMSLGVNMKRIEREANARLIASAPDLLDALLAALPFVEDAADDETYKAHRVHKVLKEIRNAIEKATGEKL